MGIRQVPHYTIYLLFCEYSIIIGATYNCDPGFCVIINNMNFDNPKFQDLNGGKKKFLKIYASRD